MSGYPTPLQKIGQSTIRKKANLDIFFIDVRPYMSLFIVLIYNNDFYNLHVSNYDICVNLKRYL